MIARVCVNVSETQKSGKRSEIIRHLLTLAAQKRHHEADNNIGHERAWPAHEVSS